VYVITRPLASCGEEGGCVIGYDLSTGV